MTTKQQLIFWKFLAVGTALFYLYKTVKAQGGTMKGRYNPEKIVNLGAQLLPEEYRAQAKQLGVAALTKWVG